MCSYELAVFTRIHEKKVHHTQDLLFSVFIFGWGTWFFAVQSMWRNLNGTDCLRGWNLLDFFNFLVLMLLSLFPAFMLAFNILGLLGKSTLNKNPFDKLGLKEKVVDKTEDFTVSCFLINE